MQASPQQDAPEETLADKRVPVWERPTLTTVGDVVALTLGSYNDDTADMQRYYY